MWPESIASEIRQLRLRANAKDLLGESGTEQLVVDHAKSLITALQEIHDAQGGHNTDLLKVDDHYDGVSVQETIATFAIQPDATIMRELDDICGNSWQGSRVRPRDYKVGFVLCLSEQLQEEDGESSIRNVALITSVYYTNDESGESVHLLPPHFESLYPEIPFTTLDRGEARQGRPSPDPTYEVASLEAGLSSCKIWLEAPGARRTI